jgi:hypothetical protein
MGLDIGLMILLCEKFVVSESKDAKTGSNLAESSKQGYNLRRAILP